MRFKVLFIFFFGVYKFTFNNFSKFQNNLIIFVFNTFIRWVYGDYIICGGGVYYMVDVEFIYLWIHGLINTCRK